MSILPHQAVFFKYFSNFFSLGQHGNVTFEIARLNSSATT